jgi:4-diphosphocytidyl-2-C-methyl-D-erythritol kinase
MNIISEIAYAKINLALHIRCRRDDGYHELDTLFAFLDDGDRLELTSATEFQLSFDGEFGGLIAGEGVENNLVTRTARAVCAGELPRIKVALTKNLPIAAGLGGGSADAAAMIRSLAKNASLDQDGTDINAIAAKLGADIPACIQSVSVIGKGTGADLSPVPNDISGLSCVLINPRIALSTASVFKEWEGVDKGALPAGTARDILENGRNDLEAAAIKLCPQISEILLYLQSSAPIIARMSGSGATCFALYDDHQSAMRVSQGLMQSHPHWWQKTGRLR